MSIFKTFKPLVLGIILGGGYILLYRTHPSFFSNLTAQIMGGGAVAVASFYFVSKHSTLFSKPNLVFCFFQNGNVTDYLELQGREDFYDLDFVVNVKNIGNKSLHEGEGYWHLFTVGECEITAPSNPGIVDGEHIVDKIKDPIFQQAF